ncbi:unnamed protein product [Blepharisma stoltei]|uniref:Uncharacterized protein n=1 Tax=Blepharisma stoltei TaxID=1481888 RepID=A0AAU9JW35_9CILI|nr:unnamed protein product [Blepharisma stoltei]
MENLGNDIWSNNKDLNMDIETAEQQRENYYEELRKKIKNIYKLSKAFANQYKNALIPKIEEKKEIVSQSPISPAIHNTTEVVLEETDVGKLLQFVKLKVKKEYPALFNKATKALKYDIDISRLSEIYHNEAAYHTFISELSN